VPVGKLWNGAGATIFRRECVNRRQFAEGFLRGSAADLRSAKRAVNPALTIMANAQRLGGHLIERLA